MGRRRTEVFKDESGQRNFQRRTTVGPPFIKLYTATGPSFPQTKSSGQIKSMSKYPHFLHINMRKYPHVKDISAVYPNPNPDPHSLKSSFYGLQNRYFQKVDIRKITLFISLN